jgi:Lon protease-like protein
MSDDSSIPGSFAGIARLFPLPNVVLFPEVVMPLHIFEPRYRQMTADVLAGDRVIAMVLLKPGWEGQYEQRPPIRLVGCLGKVVADQRLEDGRYNLLLRGLSRVRILEELEDEQAYRSARVELLRDAPLPDPALATRLRGDLAKLVAGWFVALGLSYDQLMKFFKSDLRLDVLADLLSFALPLSTTFKQDLLEELDVQQRVRRLLHYLETNEPSKQARPRERNFPPEFSPN